MKPYQKYIAAFLVAMVLALGISAAPSSFTDPAWRRIQQLAQTVSAAWTFTAGIITSTLTATSSIIAGSAGTAGCVLLYGTDGTTTSTLCVSASGNTITNNGGFVIANTFSLAGDITPSQITSNQNDYNPTNLGLASELRLSSDASRSISGLAGGSDGRVLVLSNIGSFPINLLNLSGSSSAANQFNIVGTRVINPGGRAILKYDSTLSNWLLIGESGLAPRQVIMQGSLSGLTCASNTTCFVPVVGQRQSAFVTTNGTTQSVILPFACTLQNLYFQTLGANGAQPTVVSIEVNSATATGITVTSAASDAAQVYTDVTHTYAASAGDRVYMKIAQGNGAASASLGGLALTCR